VLRPGTSPRRASAAKIMFLVRRTVPLAAVIVAMKRPRDRWKTATGLGKGAAAFSGILVVNPGELHSRRRSRE
jgi:hypothetical protein